MMPGRGLGSPYALHQRLSMEQDWFAFAAHPVVQSGVVPLGVACVTAGLLRLRGNRFGGTRGAGLAIGVGFLASALLLAGVPTEVPFSAVQKLTLLAGAGLLLGVVLELLTVSSALLRASAMGLFLAASLWLAWPQLQRNALDWPVAVVALGCAALLYGLTAPEERRADDSVPLLLAAAGIAGIALVSGSLVIAQLGTALAMAIGGFLIWNWPQARDTLGASALLGASLPVLALALMTVLLTPAPPWSLLPLYAVFFLAPVARRLWLPPGRWREAIQPLYVLFLGCVPVGLAIVLAMLAESPDDLYYR